MKNVNLTQTTHTKLIKLKGKLMERAGKSIKNADVIDYSINKALAYFDSLPQGERKGLNNVETPRTGSKTPCPTRNAHKAIQESF